MKTPKEILEAQHPRAEVRLAEIQARVLAETLAANNPVPSQRVWRQLISTAFWADVLLPARRVWLGCALAWGVILAVNLSLSASPVQGVVSTQNMVSLREQQRILAELTASAMDFPKDRPKPVGIHPQSRRKVGVFLG